ncbi:FAD-binding oxidoreductase [Draconibacterium halophilum]|uniref:Flavodoxin reductase n=1 Tax=Draconibacterium halophilum TaxID=2706887 RepID=A0A6C0RBE5_9BACT|nr:FAD-binding oxidoreductase [Draconibacterium halophilum]QIA07399.1 flavodoxin reductase [Draconibacterium halophilum]
MEHKLEIIQKKWLTHNVMQFTLRKPKGFSYSAGQAAEVTLDNPEFKDQWAPFTFTSLNKHEHLEFTIKAYPKHEGITLALSKLEKGDHMVISDPWDSFKNKGPGVFIAGGTGVTPFIALLRQMEADGKVGGSRLLFSNKTEADIFLDDEFKRILGDNFMNVLTQEKRNLISTEGLIKHFLKI